MYVAEHTITSNLPTWYNNYVGWMYILNKHGGKLPLLIKALPEGTVVSCNNGNIGNIVGAI